MHYGPESLKCEGMLAVEITENDRQHPYIQPLVLAIEATQMRDHVQACAAWLKEKYAANCQHRDAILLDDL